MSAQPQNAIFFQRAWFFSLTGVTQKRNPICCAFLWLDFARIKHSSLPAAQQDHSVLLSACAPIPLLQPHNSALFLPFPRAVFPHQTPLKFSPYDSMAQFCFYAFILLCYHCNLPKFLLPYTPTMFSAHIFNIPPSTDSRPINSPNRISVGNQQAQTHLADPKGFHSQGHSGLLPADHALDLLPAFRAPPEHCCTPSTHCHFTLQLTRTDYYELATAPSHLTSSTLDQ